MINTRLIASLRNSYSEIENKECDAEYNAYIENILDEADKESENPNAKYYTHKEIFTEMRKIINE